MAEWSEGHAAAIGSLKLNAWCKCWNLIKLETGRGHLGKGETASWEGQGVGMWEAGTFKVVAPACVC
jgi:hypothetical protein